VGDLKVKDVYFKGNEKSVREERGDQTRETGRGGMRQGKANHSVKGKKNSLNQVVSRNTLPTASPEENKKTAGKSTGTVAADREAGKKKMEITLVPNGGETTRPSRVKRNARR